MKLTTKSDQEILAIATPIMDSLMEDSTKINHTKHTKDFTERLKSIVTEEHLKNICRRYQGEWGFFLGENLSQSFGDLLRSQLFGNNGVLNRKVNLSQRSSLARQVRDIGWTT